ncbi:sarcosine oxidase subunit gamma [Salipiger bermudensis]|uniref:sarcosine oxidase subunit gamma n=2 Tax=Salipiger bermudensis TaxID=344736 RepID=UPI00355989F2
MVDLKARSPAEGLGPLNKGRFTLSEAPMTRVTALMPKPGARAALSGALKEAHGSSLPAPNRRSGPCLWAGRDTFFLIGADPAPDLEAHAAVTEQSDAWVILDLTGEGAEDVLARLVPVDLRPNAFPEDATARTLCGHMNVLIHRVEGGYRVMAFRSMARTLWHEIADAMAGVAARGEAG